MYIYSLNTLENIDENKLCVCSLTLSNLLKLSTLLRALCWHQWLSSRSLKRHWWVLGTTKHVSADIYIYKDNAHSWKMIRSKKSEMHADNSL